MVTAMEGRRTRSQSLKSVIGWASLALIYVLGLSYYKDSALHRFGLQNARTLLATSNAPSHAGVLSLFQASFYFFYPDQFIPGIDQALKGIPDLERIQIISAAQTPSGASLLFDSSDAATHKGGTPPPKPFLDAEVVSHLGEDHSSLQINGFRVSVLVPSGPYGIYYTFHATPVRNHVLLALLAGLALLGFSAWVVSRIQISRMRPGAWGQARQSWGRFWGLRSKFLLTIVLINLITGAIAFFTLSALQTREQTNRIQKESILFSRFSTSQVISDFSNFFYFYYADKFLPGIKTVIASNENLSSIRIISRRTGAVLFDSENASLSAAPQLATAPKVQFSPDVEAELKQRDLVTRITERGGEHGFSVVHAYRNESQEALFFVEYLFTFQTLARSLQLIRQQILIDLIPSLALGLLIAIVFAQLLISPIRRLVAALQRVSQGDYDVVVDVKRWDELGDLIGAFNFMTEELKKKQELRKYISDSTYRQIMEAPDLALGERLGGKRVSATVLFSDIRNFVGHCESLEAEEVTAMLNEYFSEMVEVVYKHGGEVDKFIGDAILAVFYASDETQSIRPLVGSDGSAQPSATTTSLQAIYCALEMRERLKEFNLKRENQGKNTIEIGVGITFGEIISGPIGSKDRMDFTVIGDVVNLANRIEKISKIGTHTKIVFSQHVEEKIRGLLEYEKLSHEPIRGKEEETQVFELISIRDLRILAENLMGQDTGLRCRSLELLGQSRNILGIPMILEILGDESVDVRIQAILALSKLSSKDDPKVLDALISRLELETSEKVISAGIAAVGKICTTEKVLAISRFLNSPNERIVANAVEALGQVRSPVCNDLILPKLSSRHNRVKANAAMALFASGHFEVIGTLKPMLMHSDPLMRSSAAFAIGELTLIAHKDKLLEDWKKKVHAVKFFLAELQECVPMLVTMLKDPDPMVKRQALVALGKIKDKSSVLPIIDSIEGLADSKELIREITYALRSIGSHKLVREVISRLT